MTTDDEHSASGETRLPREVQEHLGRRLRTELHMEAEKPAFLGEPTVPAQFESLVRKLEANEGGERQGYEAVRRALIGDEAVSPDERMPDAPATPLRPRIPKRSV